MKTDLSRPEAEQKLRAKPKVGRFAVAPAVGRQMGGGKDDVRTTGNRRVAVLAVHGMGQQIPFETADRIAKGLHACSEVFRSQVRAVEVGDQWLHRVELDIAAGRDTVETHIYEGYWAPLTEGKATIRDVMRFLTRAALGGIRNGTRRYERWMFNRCWHFKAPVRVVMYLMLALLVVCALVLMNTTIVVVVMGRSFLAGTLRWLSDGLIADLTTTFNASATVLGAFALSVLTGIGLQRLKTAVWIRSSWSGVSAMLFSLAAAVVVLAGFVLILLFYHHISILLTSESGSSAPLFRSPEVVAFNSWFDIVAVSFGALVASACVVYGAVMFGIGIVRDLQRPAGRWKTIFATLGGIILLILAILILRPVAGGYARVLFDDEPAASFGGGLGWILLFGGSVYIRKLLVQYVGDVAIYVTPYRLDRFYELRHEIKGKIHRIAEAIYAQRGDDGSMLEYDEVIVIGHSLGSVIAYDVLNRLVNEDTAGAGLRVAERTPLFLTFGSPLDKTAFIFSGQQNHTHDVREALAGTVQPMICDYGFRPEKWINIYSPWDLISQKLCYYDDPTAEDRREVDNKVDPEATTFLAAHVEYWLNTELFEQLCSVLKCGDATHSRSSATEARPTRRGSREPAGIQR